MSADVPPRPEHAMAISPVSGPALRAARSGVTTGFSRRTLMRRALGMAGGLWVVESLAGTLAFAWSAGRAASGVVRVGTFEEFLAANTAFPVGEGFPAYVPAAKSFVVIIDPNRGGWSAGEDETGDGRALNVRALSQICPHLGCRPNPCLEDFWMRCPCHQSRYDRLGIKVEGLRYGPAERGMDRFAIRVDGDGVLFVDTSKLTFGPLPVALGQPGVIPPLVENGCV